MIDTAYSNEALPLHTDCTYLTQQPGLQLFNCAAQASYPILLSKHYPKTHRTACADSLHSEQSVADDDTPLAGSTRLADSLRVAEVH